MPNQTFNTDSLQRGILLRKILRPTANHSAGKPAPFCRLTWRYEHSMKKLIFILLVLFSGCASVDVSEMSMANEIIGHCYEFSEVGELVQVPGSAKESVLKYTNSYLFLSSASQIHHREKSDKSKLITLIEPGQKLRVVKIVDFPYGSAGHCWVVKARLLGIDTKNDLVELPSCWVWDEPIWVAPLSPYELEENPEQKIRVETPVLKASSCS